MKWGVEPPVNSSTATASSLGRWRICMVERQVVCNGLHLYTICSPRWTTCQHYYQVCVVGKLDQVVSGCHCFWGSQRWRHTKLVWCLTSVWCWLWWTLVLSTIDDAVRMTRKKSTSPLEASSGMSNWANFSRRVEWRAVCWNWVIWQWQIDS